MRSGNFSECHTSENSSSKITESGQDRIEMLLEKVKQLEIENYQLQQELDMAQATHQESERLRQRIAELEEMKIRTPLRTPSMYDFGSFHASRYHTPEALEEIQDNKM